MTLLEELIKEGKALTSSIVRNTGEWATGYRAVDESKYQSWIAQCTRYVRTHYPDELADLISYTTLKTNPSSHNKIVGVLEAIKLIPEKNSNFNSDTTDKTGINIHNYNSQTQTQSQEIAVNIFLEAIKDELTGKQVKELREIIELNKETPDEIKPKLMEKLQGFGIGVLSGIIGNIITNPSIII